MQAFWAFLIVITVAFFLFVILPSLLTPPVTAQSRPYTQPRPAVVIPPETRQQIERRESRIMLDAYYQNGRETVPEDYPRRNICECPYSKPPSTDLPIVNTPMCVSVTSTRSLKDMLV
jgi:hypothetical protein